MGPANRRCLVVAMITVAALATACAGAPAGAPDVPEELRDLVADLREGGHVLFLRHAATDTSIPAGGDDHRADCSLQRNLTRRGREDAEALGDAFRALGIPVSGVLTSPLCRTLDTARIAFGDVTPDVRLLPGSGAEGPGGPDESIRPLLTPPSEGNRILVGHASTMANLLDVHLEEGEAAVLLPDPNGDPQLVGRLSADALGMPGAARR